MSNYIVSARKYRPRRFDEVVGQQNVTNTLKNAIKTQQVAHSFLFCGPRGVGKTTCARILAKTINCENLGDDFEACEQCTSCKAFQENGSLNIFEMDAASNSQVDDIRTLTDQVRYAPQTGTYKIYIIDEVHMLSQSAFNAFLKTLEEPPSYAIFILATTEKHKLLPTILSRCQIFDFNRIRIEEIVDFMEQIAEKEGIEADRNGLHIIAQKADGALRDALSMFDRLLTFSGNSLSLQDVLDNLNILDYDYYFKVTDALLAGDVANVLLTFDDILRKGFEGDVFINGLAEHFRDLLVCKDPNTVSLLEVTGDLKTRYQEQAALAPASFLLNALNLASQCDMNYKASKNKRLHVELALIKMGHISQAVDLASSQNGGEGDDNGQSQANASTPADAKKKPISDSKKAQPAATFDETTEQPVADETSSDETYEKPQQASTSEQPSQEGEQHLSAGEPNSESESLPASNTDESSSYESELTPPKGFAPDKSTSAQIETSAQTTIETDTSQFPSAQEEANNHQEHAVINEGKEPDLNGNTSVENEEAEHQVEGFRFNELNSTDENHLSEHQDNEIEAASDTELPENNIPEEEAQQETQRTTSSNNASPQHQDSAPKESMNGSFTLSDLQNNYISIQHGQNTQDTDHEVSEEDVSIDEDQLLQVWEQYTQELYANKRLSLYGFMKDITPKVNESSVEIVLTNKLQEEIFANERQKLNEYLKQQLGIPFLRLVMKVDKNQESQSSNRPFTAKEKMEKMAEKNDKLLKLKDELDLDLEH